MSRPQAALYGGGASTSESDSEESVGEIQETRPARRWLSDSDSDSDHERRQARSEKERHWASIASIGTAITTGLKNKDWSKVFDDVGKLETALEKAKALIARDGVPTFLLKVIRDLSRDCAAVTRAEQKAMKKAVSISFIKVNSKVKTLVAAHKTALDSFTESAEGEDEAEEWQVSDDESSSSSGEEELVGRMKWVKPEYRKKYLQEAAELERSSQDSDDSGSTHSDDDDDSEPDVVPAPRVDPAPAPAPVIPLPPAPVVPIIVEDMTPAVAQKRLVEIEALKGEDKLAKLRFMLGATAEFGPEFSLVILCQILATRFVGRRVDDKLSRPAWLQCITDIHIIVDILQANPSMRLEFEDSINFVRVKASAAGLMGKAVDTASSAVVRVTPGPHGTKTVPVVSQPFLIAQNLSDDYLKSLRALEMESVEYRTRLMDEELLVELLRRLFDYYKQDAVANTDASSRLSLLWLKHGYYKHETMADALYKANFMRQQREQFGNLQDYHPACLGQGPAALSAAVSHPACWGAKPALPQAQEDQAELVRGLAGYVNKHGTVADKPTAALMHIYHAAVHNRYVEAKELMLASRLHDDMRERDENTQILFNRAMAQIAMAAFRAGLISDAHSILANIFQRRAFVRELLAQGSSQKYGKVDFEREKAEKRRRFPAHMFINVDQLEACHLVCSMLLEVPVVAACQYDSRSRNRLSQAYYKLVEERDRMPIIGPPEATDDCVRVGVMQASQYLAEGDWKKCVAVLQGFGVWNLWPAGYAAALAPLLADKVKEAALEVFLYTRGPHHASLSQHYLSTLFELPDARVRSFVSTFVVNKDFSASWDDATGTLIIHDTVPTKVQGITADLVDKLAAVLDIVERNERGREPRDDPSGAPSRDRRGQGPPGKFQRQQQQSSSNPQSQARKQYGFGYGDRGQQRGQPAASRAQTWA